MIHPYGEAPVDLGALDLPEWQEFMHYLYLPIRMPGMVDDPETEDCYALPDRLAFLDLERDAEDGFTASVFARVMEDVRTGVSDGRWEHLSDPYVYVTARRGYATPGNPLNRPGWHCDDFMGRDLNYIWSDAYPTRILRSDKPLPIPADDEVSMAVMQGCADRANGPGRTPISGLPWIEDAPAGHLLRLTPYVIHDTPEIPAPGGMRSFFKISVSEHRYNLVGNSHNHLLDYDWPMHDRAVVRNQPQGGNSDYVIEEPADA